MPRSLFLLGAFRVGFPAISATPTFVRISWARENCAAIFGFGEQILDNTSDDWSYNQKTGITGHLGRSAPPAGRPVSCQERAPRSKPVAMAIPGRMTKERSIKFLAEIIKQTSRKRG
jgi:hypothetical protein